MSKAIVFAGLLVLLVLFFGCTQTQQQDNNHPLIGGDKDSHGCLVGGGYSWCSEKQKCLRVWEESCADTNNQVSGDSNFCACPNGYVQDGETCTPSCYYSTPACLMPSMKCSASNNQPSNGLANPASVNCETNGGSLEIVTDENGGQFGMCALPDGNVCEEWAFFRGECN